MKVKFENGFVYTDENDYEKPFEDSYGEPMNEDQFRDEFVQCDRCGDWFFSEDTTYCSDNDEFYCIDCRDEVGAFCEDCGDFRLFRNLIEPEDRTGYFYCDRWQCTNNLYHCNDCGGYFYYEDSVHYHEYDDCDYCDECYPRHDDGDCLGDYHEFKDYGEIEFCGSEEREKSPYMGFELEIDHGHRHKDATADIYDIFGDFFHCERDGSLDSGFEIISQPASLEYHMDNMSGYAEICRDLIDYGYTSHNAGSCGLHVHIDKDYFENKLDASEAKMLYIFQKHWENLLRFSRRTNHQANQWCARYGYNDGSPKEVVDKIKKNPYSITRYRAVNLTNSDTIEIRLWRGTLRPETLEATLRFTARLAELCKSTPAAELGKMTFKEILGDDEVILSYWETVKDRNV